jgi:hypothetical protein
VWYVEVVWEKRKILKEKELFGQVNEARRISNKYYITI